MTSPMDSWRFVKNMTSPPDHNMDIKSEEVVLRWEGDYPWLDMHLSKVTMNKLWDLINNPTQPIKAVHTPKTKLEVGSKISPHSQPLAGNISNSIYIKDKDNWFYENVLKEWSKYLFFRDSWCNYYEVVVTKSRPLPEFELKELWVNYQKQHEFNPPHRHTGIYSFVVFMKIPTHWKEQHELPLSVNSNAPCASNFQFLWDRIGASTKFFLSPEDEGRMLFFPAWLHHEVFPFYECEEERITLSGNIILCQK